MQAAFPSSEPQFHLPPESICDRHSLGGPNGSGNMGNEEIPRQERERGLGGRGATLLGDGLSLPPPFVHNCFRHAHRNEAGRNTFVGPEDNGFLKHGAGIRGKPLGQI
jgi:hypothetical protein